MPLFCPEHIDTLVPLKRRRDTSESVHSLAGNCAYLLTRLRQSSMSTAAQFREGRSRPMMHLRFQNGIVIVNRRFWKPKTHSFLPCSRDNFSSLISSDTHGSKAQFSTPVFCSATCLVRSRKVSVAIQRPTLSSFEPISLLPSSAQCAG